MIIYLIKLDSIIELNVMPEPGIFNVVIGGVNMGPAVCLGDL